MYAKRSPTVWLQDKRQAAFLQSLVLVGPADLSYAATHLDLLDLPQADLLSSIQSRVMSPDAPDCIALAQKPGTSTLSRFYEFFPWRVLKKLYGEMSQELQDRPNLNTKQMAAALARHVDQASPSWPPCSHHYIAQALSSGV